ncbi:tyrosine-protein phosphatase non-receptor type 9-like isoform X2 [Rhopilema esculentum]|uniref:tyrosine-protein phosphatase non-receptor type 9-like isoform X2 n=1 Tax=Rhopilema esculentum TaxID=499914 RepID=UPI0031D70DAB
MAAEHNGVDIDEEIRYSEEETKAIEQFLFAVNERSNHHRNEDVADHETAVKFLHARKFETERAISLFRAHLFGEDFTGASVCLFTERLHFPKKTTHRIVLKSLIFQLNELIARHDTQRKGIVLIYDMTKAAYRNFDYELCTKTLRILKGAFPARLKHVYILAAPLWFRASLSILSNFVGEKITSRVETLKKTEDLLSRIPASTIPVHLGGTSEHDHDMWLEICVSNYLRKNEASARKNNQIERGFGKTKSFADRLREAAEEDREREQIRVDGRLNVDELVNYMNSVGRRGIYDEYLCIQTVPPSGRFTHSKHPFNFNKNRYRDVLCYDHSRVKLKVIGEDDFTDYINASFVDGHNCQNAYICTQGPLPNTAFDFWRMVLEQKPNVVLMLSRCFERGREKCFRYWPEEKKSTRFESITVQNLGVVESTDYIVRKLEVQSKEGNPPHRVTHFQFTAWPDYGVPESADKLLDVMNQVRTFQNLTTDLDDIRESIPSHSTSSPEKGLVSQESPLIVHCSAGIGRTGTYITTDVCLREFDATGTVDIQSTVQRIRRQRALAVQTEEQYAFCYSALLEYCLKASRANEKLCGKITKCLDRFKSGL